MQLPLQFGEYSFSAIKRADSQDVKILFLFSDFGFLSAARFHKSRVFSKSKKVQTLKSITRLPSAD